MAASGWQARDVESERSGAKVGEGLAKRAGVKGELGLHLAWTRSTIIFRGTSVRDVCEPGEHLAISTVMKPPGHLAVI